MSRGQRYGSRDTLYPLKFALTSPTSHDFTVGIVRLRTEGHEVIIIFISKNIYRTLKARRKKISARRLLFHKNIPIFI
jgi:hypothetical protein